MYLSPAEDSNTNDNTNDNNTDTNPPPASRSDAGGVEGAEDSNGNTNTDTNPPPASRSDAGGVEGAAAVPNLLPASRSDAGNGEEAVPEASPASRSDAGGVEGAATANHHEDGHEVLRLRGGGESSSEEEDEGKSSEAEEGASSEEEDAADDIEVTETFDEVEFGDGDESHQIYTNMSGIVITWNTCTEHTFKVFREELCDMFGVEPTNFLYCLLFKSTSKMTTAPGTCPTVHG